MIQAGSIHIGTSGWSYQHWKKIFYPENLPQVDWLRFYSNRFSSTEVNTSFYHLPSAETTKAWKQKVLPGFFFCPKISRYLTHMKKLNNAKEVMQLVWAYFNNDIHGYAFKNAKRLIEING